MCNSVRPPKTGCARTTRRLMGERPQLRAQPLHLLPEEGAAHCRDAPS